jgi:UrcA family protein
MTTLLKATSIAAAASAALLAMAASAQAETVRIQVSDLNLNTPQGLAQFNARVDRAARQICAGDADMHMNIQCRRAVREEAYDNLHDQQEQLARAGGVSVARAGSISVARAGRR